MPYVQSWLPIINPDPKNWGPGLPPPGGGYDVAAARRGQFSGQVLGLYAIASGTSFSGNETTFALAQGPVPVTLITPRQSGIRPNLGSYMAAVPTRADWVSNGVAVTYPQIRKEELPHFNLNSGGRIIGSDLSDSPNYRHRSEFIPISAVMPSYRWINTQPVQNLIITPGALINALQDPSGLGINASVASANNPPAASTVSTPLALTWDASVPFSNAPPLTFFDFNWVQLFALSSPTTEPAMIQVATNPAGLAASVIQSAQPLMNTIVYNTIRITKLPGAPLAAGGPFAFTFNIYDKKGNAAVVATLNLTVT